MVLNISWLLFDTVYREERDLKTAASAASFFVQTIDESHFDVGLPRVSAQGV